MGAEGASWDVNEGFDMVEGDPVTVDVGLVFGAERS